MLRALPLLALLLFAACKAEPETPPASAPAEPAFRLDGTLDFLRPDSTPVVRIGIEIAETPQATAQGLMYRRSMAERAGMLFIMPTQEVHTFYMRNTLIPLDLVFADSSLRIVHVAKGALPLDETLIPSVEPARYVVEVNAGFADRYGLTPGYRIRYRRGVPEA